MKYEETVEYIRDLAIGYDGFNTVESLKGLIDEMREVAEKIIEASQPDAEANKIVVGGVCNHCYSKPCACEVRTYGRCKH